MIKPNLIEYIKTQLRQGATKHSVTSTMIAGGWDAKEIEAAFAEASQDFKLMESSESFTLVTEGTGKYYFWRVVKVALLLIIIILCFLFYLGGA